jgi:hypothetical protein
MLLTLGNIERRLINFIQKTVTDTQNANGTVKRMGQHLNYYSVDFAFDLYFLKNSKKT